MNSALKKISFVVCGFIFSTGLIAPAALPPQHLQKVYTDDKLLKNYGVARGGAAGKGFSVLAMRASNTKDKKLERLVLDIGNSSMLKNTGKVGYYNIELKQNPNRLIIDLAQTLNAKLNQRDINAIVAKSEFFKKGQLLFDSQSRSLSLVFDLKQKAEIKVQDVEGTKETSKLVIDFKKI